MNDVGQVVGAYNDSAGNQHGFLLSAGNFSTIDFPGAVQVTMAGSINNQGQIMGYGNASGNTRGFFLSASSSPVFRLNGSCSSSPRLAATLKS